MFKNIIAHDKFSFKFIAVCMDSSLFEFAILVIAGSNPGSEHVEFFECPSWILSSSFPVKSIDESVAWISIPSLFLKKVIDYRKGLILFEAEESGKIELYKAMALYAG